MRGDLHLSYGQIGLLFAVPLLAGSLLELPLGLVAGQGRRRQWFVLAGGAVFIAAVAAVAAASSFAVLLAAFVLFFPASGAFVSLTQSALMDSDPARQQQGMAAWNLAGSVGDVAGPLLLAGVLTVGGTWRAAYLAVAACAVLALAGSAWRGPGRAGPAGGGGDGDDGDGEHRPPLRQVLCALRSGDVVRWVVLLEISDLLLDVLTGFVGVYLVDVVHATPAQAAIGVAVRLGAGLAGDALYVLLSSRVSGPAALRLTAAVAAAGYPLFLLVPGLPAKLVILALVSAATACWYPVLMAELYGSLPGRSGVAVFLGSAAGLAGALGPLTAGFVAQQVGLSWAMTGLVVAPLAILALQPGRRRGQVSKQGRAAAP
jgi:MFS transporter, FSR family, fosmidomycin resistance protein